ncbi:MAG TPA: hypothetical protein VED40_02220 [Azospirillaceae bacterium]|nr:hypothetical protein [Azospirillaceae bacterium]
MPTTPEEFLELARESVDRPGAQERHWRDATRCAHDAVYMTVAGALALDTATFSGSHRAVGEALFAQPRSGLTGFLRLARRHWNTLWLARLRAERDLEDAVGEADARLSILIAESILAARRSELQ